MSQLSLKQTPRSVQNVNRRSKNYWSNQDRNKESSRKNKFTGKNFGCPVLPKVFGKNTLNKANFSCQKFKFNQIRNFSKKKQKAQKFIQNKKSINKLFKTINKNNKFFDDKETFIKSESSISMVKNLSKNKKNSKIKTSKIKPKKKKSTLISEKLERNENKNENKIKNTNFHSHRQILRDREEKLNSAKQVNVIKLHGNINNFYNYSNFREKLKECANSVNFRENELTENVSIDSKNNFRKNASFQ